MGGLSGAPESPGRDVRPGDPGGTGAPASDRVGEWLDLVIRLSSPDSYVIYADARGTVTRLKKSDRFPFPIEVGDRLEQDHLKTSNTARCWRERKYLEVEGNPATFGFRYMTKSVALYAGEEFAGALSVVFPADSTKRLLEEGVAHLSEQVGVLSDLGRDMAEAGVRQVKNAEAIAESVDSLHERTKALEEINELVAEVARQTDLLGLNAAIEAARAGDKGRGFGVVAEEIRRLSGTVRDSASQVGDNIKRIQEAMARIRQAAQASVEDNGRLSSRLEDLSASVDQVHQTMTALSAAK